MTTPARTVVLQKRPDYPSFGIYIGEDFPTGIYIVTTEAKSPAAEAGIQPGDRILAFNDQSVVSMTKSPKDTLIQLAASAQTLKLSVQSTNALDAIIDATPANTSMPTYSNGPQSTNHSDALTAPIPSLNWPQSMQPYPTRSKKPIDDDLENYIKSIFSDPTLQIIAGPEGRSNEYILVSHQNSSSSFYPPSIPHQNHHHRHHHSHRKRRHHSRKEVPDAHPPVHKEDPQPPGPGRGGALAMFSTLPLNPTDTNHNNDQQGAQTVPNGSHQPSTPPNPVPLPVPSYSILPPANNLSPPNPVGNPPPYTPATPTVVPNPENPPNTAPAPPNSDGTREVRLRRSTAFQGYGFHLQYNRVYYIIQLVEKDSPAEEGGLQENDVIRQVNRHSTEGMPHGAFVHHINTSDEVTFLVQSFDDYFRANPHVPGKPSPERVAAASGNPEDKRTGVLSKALTKLKSH